MSNFNALREGVCHGNYDCNDKACTEICYASETCIKETERRGKLKPINFEKMHNEFISKITDIFPRMQHQLYEGQGIVYDFYNSLGIFSCRIKAKLPEYSMQIEILKKEVIFGDINQPRDIEDLYQQVKNLYQQ